MKHYDHESRKWLNDEEFKNLSEKRKGCKGGRKEHDFLLVLPHWGVTYDEKYKFDPMVYYDMMKEVEDYHEKKKQELADQGIITYVGYNGRTKKHYTCSVCGKHKYE